MLGDKDYFIGYFTVADLYVVDWWDAIDVFDSTLLD
jgi:glutathione S-transferase